MSVQLNILLLGIRYRVEIIIFPSSQWHGIIDMGTDCGAACLCSYFTLATYGTVALGKLLNIFCVSVFCFCKMGVIVLTS